MRASEIEKEAENQPLGGEHAHVLERLKAMKAALLDKAREVAKNKTIVLETQGDVSSKSKEFKLDW